MSKNVAAVLVLVFLTGLCIMVAKPASSSAKVVENSWASKAPMHVAIAGLGVAVVNGKIYAIGGSTRIGGGGTRSGPLPVTGGIVGTNEEYDPVTDTWIFRAPMPTPRTHFAIAVYQNKIYCMGGQMLKSSAPSAGVNEVYDPATDSWTTKAHMPTASYGYASAVVDNKIYIIDSNLNQIYDTETDMWSRGALMPLGARIGYETAGATTAVNAPKRIYVLVETVEGEPSNSNMVYDPENDSWTFGANVPTNLDGFGVAVESDMLYAIGGYSYSYPDGIWSQPYGLSITPHATNEQYTPIGYGAVPPKVAVVSPENKTYVVTSVPLTFTVNKPAVWMGYSLDGHAQVTITGNTTLAGLPSGLHNVTVYARDEFENTGASEIITFTVEESGPFPTALVAAASGASIAVIVVGLLVYFKKRKR